MKRYFDTTLKLHSKLWETSPEHVRVSFAGENLGTRSFIGHLVKDLGPNGLEELAGKPAVIYIDDILKVDPDSILNPGLFAEFIKGVFEDASPFWDVILTKGIEREV